MAKGCKSYDTTLKALQLIQNDIDVPADIPVLIKPNMVFRSNALCATPVEAVRATMNFLTSKGVKKFVVGEGTGEPEGNTMGAFEDYGYFALQNDFDVEFRNLNIDEWVSFEIRDTNLEPATIRLAKSYFDSYVVSVARMKTHMMTQVTLAIKNIAVGSIINEDRHAPSWHEPEPGRFSHAPQPLNLNIARIIQAVQPNLAVIDGVVGMEGEGPGNGTPVESGIALASEDFLSIDVVGTELMGADPRVVGYLWYLMKLENFRRAEVEVVGEDPKTCVTRYQMYEGLPSILGWWIEKWRDYIDVTPVKAKTGPAG